MSTKKILHLSGKKEKTNMAEATELLNDEIKGFMDKLDKSQAKSLSQMKISLVSDEIILLPMDEEGIPVLLLGICKLDDKYYGALFNTVTGEGGAEELYVGVIKGSQTNIKGSRLIEEESEWHVISEFFQSQNIYERHRIINWVFAAKQSSFSSVMDVAKKMSWIDKVNGILKQKNSKPLMPAEIAMRAISGKKWHK